ncbi:MULTISPECIES: GspH/FimT family pseudopilin [unclassified Bradyrhizobium]|uniref:GspH/FimT family pseudopilin n=1 Tax=unclassified Bradyrhizobium TaxID=2631580 RepID=UPI002916DE6C|nr:MULTISPECIES: GspH/FimT family pseudopilin [unclassified Bradyrhizobium]
MSALTSEWQDGTSAGFTLVEMLAVLVILALAAAAAVPMLSRGTGTVSLDAATGELASALRATRAAAIVQNRVMTLSVDVDRRTFGSEVVSSRSFAPQIQAKLTYAAATQSEPAVGGFRFFPDGSSTGGDLSLELGGREVRLCVGWLTGTVRTAAAC